MCEQAGAGVSKLLLLRPPPQPLQQLLLRLPPPRATLLHKYKHKGLGYCESRQQLLYRRRYRCCWSSRNLHCHTYYQRHLVSKTHFQKDTLVSVASPVYSATVGTNTTTTTNSKNILCDKDFTSTEERTSAYISCPLVRCLNSPSKSSATSGKLLNHLLNACAQCYVRSEGV
ncbi:hypothetical protein PoB_000320300 [Plakobranchus ocellatus]|uniref:Uncharacterized protein n=1 Tax=Plakobranchus ocellatus TaxID=259542 RepID=A0AAV3Y232_9GAST|nr:hypothetical protein PoB_000320300 [Plakobranchus ocellatus]